MTDTTVGIEAIIDVCLHVNVSRFLPAIKCSLQRRHNERNDASNHRRLDCIQPFVQAQINENFEAPRHLPLWEESTGDRWILLTKVQ